MKTLDEIKAILAKHKEELKVKYNIKEIGVFGSFVRGEENRKSDIDILVEFNEVPDIFLLIDLEDYLKKLLHKKVDLVRKSAIRPELKDAISEEAVYI
ncbi:MAG: nucleotidyltransferase family protein [bacterium]